jgi:hypothetical protein
LESAAPIRIVECLWKKSLDVISYNVLPVKKNFVGIVINRGNLFFSIIRAVSNMVIRSKLSSRQRIQKQKLTYLNDTWNL